MLTTTRKRLLSALLLTPGIMLLLVWIGRFAGAETAAGMGIVPFLLWALAAAFGIAATITLYIAYVTQPTGRE
jgi:hypothetical protein